MYLLKLIKHKLKLAKDAWNASDKGLTDAVNIVLSLVVIGVAVAIGLFIMDRVSIVTAIPPYNANGSVARNHIGNASNSTFGTIDTGFSFVVILVIAFIGTIALGYIYGMLPGQKSQQ